MVKRTYRKLALLILPIVVLFSPESLLAGWDSIGPVTEWHRIHRGVVLSAGRHRVAVEVLTDTLVRLRAIAEGEFPPLSSFAVQQRQWPAIPFEIREAGDAIELITKSLRIEIRRQPLRIALFDSKGNLVNRDDAARGMAWDSSQFRVWKSLFAGDHFYGLGEKAGPLDRRGHTYILWNTDNFGWQESTDPLYKSVPFFLALRDGVASGIFVDNTYRSFFEFGKESDDYYSFGADNGELRYYFIYGPDPKSVIEQFADLVGRIPMFPRFALGYQQSRYSYYPESEVLRIAKEFRRRRIPADVIYLDIDYMEGYKSFTVSKENFPHFGSMLSELAKQGFKVVCIVDPAIKKDESYSIYVQGLPENYFVHSRDDSYFVGKVWAGDSLFPDFASSDARKWWGTLYNDLIGDGVRGIWNDMNEPTVFARPDKTMPLDVLHNVDGRLATHAEIHNVYGMLMSAATFEGLEAIRPHQRPFVLTRASFAGGNRYAATWTGDNTSSWNHLRLSVPSVLGLGLSGFALSGADVGGFVGSTPPELLTRWIQLGAFLPFFRDHTMKGTKPQEPWIGGAEQEAIRRHFIEVRYELLPYLYTLMEESHRTGLPIARPLFLEYPSGDCANKMDEEFLLGRDLLIAPVVWEMTDPQEVCLPKGDWFDFWTGKRITEGFQLKRNIDLETIPIFVRGGTILPMQPVVQNSEEIPAGPLSLLVYPDSACQGGQLYWDDGETDRYREGDYARWKLGCSLDDNTMDLSVSAQDGRFQPWWRSIQFEVFDVNNTPQSVQSGGNTITEVRNLSALDSEQPHWFYDSKNQRLLIRVPYSAQETRLKIVH